MIKIEKLRMKFPKEETLLFTDLNLTINKGEKVLFLGPSGCGKSTLLQVIAGIIPRSIEVPMKAEELILPKKVGYVFQDPESQFCMPYVDEEIAFVLENLQVPREEMNNKIHHYIKQVGLDGVFKHTKIDALSGGQKQRLAIASVLALEPEVLLLDEPSAMLDAEGTEHVWKTIGEVMNNRTVIIVEHKIDHVLEFVDRIIVFNNDGEIVADGLKHDVLTKCISLLKSHGIWYPGVWENYLYKTLMWKDEEFTRTSPIIKLRNFKVFRKKEVFVTVEEADVFEGEWIAITGRNGVGKSTLLLGMMQLLKTSGEFELYGKSVSRKDHLSQKMAYVFQNPEFQFVTHSVYDELAHSSRLLGEAEEVIEKTVLSTLEKFSLFEHRHKHPYELSIGQKRRLSVASMMMNNQKIILLDEPTFGQDSKNTFELLEHLNKERKNGATIFMITHDHQIVESFATRVWRMEDGRLIDDVVVTRVKNDFAELIGMRE